MIHHYPEKFKVKTVFLSNHNSSSCSRENHTFFEADEKLPSLKISQESESPLAINKLAFKA